MLRYSASSHSLPAPLMRAQPAGSAFFAQQRGADWPSAEDQLRAFEKCVGLNDLFAPCHVHLARAHAKLGDQKAADHHLARAAELSSVNDEELDLR